MDGRKIFVGLPVYANPPAEFEATIDRLKAGLKVPFVIARGYGDGINRSRNRLTAEFLKSDCTHLYWCDDDLVPRPEDVMRLIEHDLPVCGLLYCCKNRDELQLCINGHGEEVQLFKPGVVQVRYVGTGQMLVKREVFDKMIEAFGPQIGYQSDFGSDRRTEYDFWGMEARFVVEDGRRRYLSEDWLFCQRWADLGGKVFADTETIVPHIGPTWWPLPHHVPQQMIRGWMKERGIEVEKCGFQELVERLLDSVVAKKSS